MVISVLGLTVPVNIWFYVRGDGDPAHSAECRVLQDPARKRTGSRPPISVIMRSA
jgi:hypothetical protein